MNMQAPITSEDITAALGIDPRAKTKRWARRLAYGLIAAVILGGASYWYQSSGSTANALTYDTSQAERMALIVNVTATGTVQPTTQVDVSSEISGVVRIVNVDNNSVVKKGDVLAVLDLKRLDTQLARAKASLASSEAKLARRQGNL